jgi:hypothetical protein
MEFTLHYRGPLKSNARPAEKHKLRCVFHEQLKQLWQQEPLVGRDKMLEPDTEGNSLVQTLRGFSFLSLVSKRIDMIAELDITLLRPEPPGSIIGRGGDIDNRLKTLFDALKAPSDPSDLPRDASPTDDQQPYFFCLLEDDRLITRISVDTAQLLEPVQGDTEVDLIVRVQAKLLSVRWETIGL